MANAELKNWPGVADKRPMLKTDTYRGEDFVAAVNCNRELYTGFDNIKAMREKAREAFAVSQKS